MHRYVLLLALLAAALAPGAPRAQYVFEPTTRFESTSHVNDLPLRQAFELALQARLTYPELTRTLIRAHTTTDTTLVPLLWQVARAYARTGGFSAEIFEVLRRLGERDETFLAEAEAVAPTVPPWRLWSPAQRTVERARRNNDSVHLASYVRALVNAAAVRADSSLLPRVLAIDGLNPDRLGDASQSYQRMVSYEIPTYQSLSREDQIREGLGSTMIGFAVPGAGGGYRGPHFWGNALYASYVFGRERLAEFYAENPAEVESILQTMLAERQLSDATDLRAWVLLQADVPVAVAKTTALPTCAGQTATVYVGPGRRIVGGPLDGQIYAGTLEGTDDPDVLVGTPAPDLIFGRAGADILCGGAGDDALIGGSGADTADGGDGTDGCNTETATACEGPVPTLARIEPLAGCITLRPNGRYTAYFGYDNTEARPGQVAHGADNQMVLRPFDRIGEEVIHKPVQPAWFAVPVMVPGAPGRTAPFPESAFSVTHSVGDAVVWQLLGQEVVLSPDSPPCPTP